MLYLPKDGEGKIDKPDTIAADGTKAGETEGAPAQHASRKELPTGEAKPAETSEKGNEQKE